MTYATRIISMAILPEGQPLFSEMATKVSIVDQAAGEYVEVEQHGRTDIGKICISPDEWPKLKRAIDTMIAECKDVRT